MATPAAERGHGGRTGVCTWIVRKAGQRIRLHPGPRVLGALAWLLVAATAVRAHDPGLSALDVTVDAESVSVSLSLAAADVALVAPTESDPRRRLLDLTRDSVRIAVDDAAVPPGGEEISVDSEGARIRLIYSLPKPRTSIAAPEHTDRTRHLDIVSAVPQRLARGHRELLTVRIGDRVAIERLLDAELNSVTVDLGTAPSGDSPAGSVATRARSFLALGVRHILTGYDHLVFLAGLLLASCTLRQLLVSLTVFTAAHSISLTLVVAGGVHAPPSIVEPLIAASIAWIGIENLLRGPMARRWPGWSARRRPVYALVFGFGLIHGFGLAGALMELGVGVSAGHLALALLSFNAGVEAGQLAAATAVLPLVWTIRARTVWQATLVPVCSALIVIAGGYWLVERL